MPENEKSTICVFVAVQYAELFPNFDSLFRTNNSDEGSIIFDCISAVDTGNYLHIVATSQSFPGVASDAEIWIPTRYVLGVLFHPTDKKQMGFVLSPQDDIHRGK